MKKDYREKAVKFLNLKESFIDEALNFLKGTEIKVTKYSDPALDGLTQGYKVTSPKTQYDLVFGKGDGNTAAVLVMMNDSMIEYHLKRPDQLGYVVNALVMYADTDSKVIAATKFGSKVLRPYGLKYYEMNYIEKTDY